MTQTNPVKVIRAYCVACSHGQHSEVEHCPVERCELYPFRMGKNPYRKKKTLSPEQRSALVQRLNHD